MHELVRITLYLVGAGCIFGLLIYLVSLVPMPEPWKKFITIGITILAVVMLIYLILNLMGPAPQAIRGP